MATKRTEIQGTVETPVDTVQAAAEEPEKEVTLETAAKAQNHSLLIKDQNRKKLVIQYGQEKRKPVMIAPMYIPYFGNIMHVKLNGISIAVPCNGKPYDIPESYAAEVMRRLRAINEQQQKQKRYADVSANVENAPGELALF